MRRNIFSAFVAILFYASAALGVVGTSSRGYQGYASDYRQKQRNTYYMVTQPDIDSECRARIYNCLSNYCGDVTVVDGAQNGRCNYATESELYNFILLCLSKDRTPLLPQYNVNTATGLNGLNNAARLCPSYVQSELMAYLSMANMSDKLTRSRSDECVGKRQELATAIACHQVALAYGNGTQNRLVAELTDTCGDNTTGGSLAMVQRFATAGNLGANVLGWAEKIVSVDLSNKGPDWQLAMDQVLAYYTNGMNLACGDNLQMNIPERASAGVAGDEANLPTLKTIANLALDTYSQNELESLHEAAIADAPAETIWMEVYAASDVYDFATARQVVNAGLTNSPLTQNAFLASSQMATMQDRYKYGTKVYILRDPVRCWIVPVRGLSQQEQSALAQTFASCGAR